MEKTSAAADLRGKTLQLPLESSKAGEQSSGPKIGEYLRFLGSFIRRPRIVGAIAPSSRRLAEAMIPSIDLRPARAVVELGAGTGAVTQALRMRVGTRTCLIAVELDAESARRLQRRFRDVHVIDDTAENLRRHLDLLGHCNADAIISGLPWGNMSDGVQDSLLDAIMASLKPGGRFSAMAYLHAGAFPSSRKFRRKLQIRFAEVEESPVVWLNMPPAFVYHCR
jgi:phospholipid N-methyltransferase